MNDVWLAGVCPDRDAWNRVKLGKFGIRPGKKVKVTIEEIGDVYA